MKLWLMHFLTFKIGESYKQGVVMKKVITYGTYDLLHFGHIRLLERAKALGDYLIVGVTSDDFDKSRGKINVQQSLTERIENVRSTGLADEIIIEEYEGQKIDDIKRYGVDVFTVGSDWVGQFDYLKEYCEVVYLDRTTGISSTELREKEHKIRFGIYGNVDFLLKYVHESSYVNGIEISGVCTEKNAVIDTLKNDGIPIFDSYDNLLEVSDAVYIVSHPTEHYNNIKQALKSGKHVICESPITLNVSQSKELHEMASSYGLILMEAIKTAYSMAYSRMMLLLKTGIIGKIVSVDAVCTSLSNSIASQRISDLSNEWNSITAWGPTGMLPVFQLLGTDYKSVNMDTLYLDKEKSFDLFTRINFTYSDAVASVKVGKGVKSEGELVISGTKGYIYVPAPWWKTDYFEVRYENQSNNKRYFYQLDGEGIRYELVQFLKAVESGKDTGYVSREVSCHISDIMDKFFSENNIRILNTEE